jgi:hypothetical protein
MWWAQYGCSLRAARLPIPTISFRNYRRQLIYNTWMWWKLLTHMLARWWQHLRPWRFFCWTLIQYVLVRVRRGKLSNFPSKTPIVSLAATQSTLLSHQVYLTDRIDNKKRDRMPHMKCVCFLQSSEDSLGALEDELKEPKYGEYYLCQWVNLLWSTSPKPST